MIRYSNLFARSCKSPSALFLFNLASSIGGSAPNSSDLELALLPRVSVCLLDDDRAIVLLGSETELTRLESLIFEIIVQQFHKKIAEADATGISQMSQTSDCNCCSYGVYECHKVLSKIT